MSDTRHERILRVREVCERTGYSRPTIYRKMAEGKFPKPVKLSENGAVGFVESEIAAFVRELIAQRDAAQVS